MDTPDYIDFIAHNGRQTTMEKHANKYIEQYQDGHMTLEELIVRLDTIVSEYAKGLIN